MIVGSCYLIDPAGGGAFERLAPEHLAQALLECYSAHDGATHDDAQGGASSLRAEGNAGAIGRFALDAAAVHAAQLRQLVHVYHHLPESPLALKQQLRCADLLEGLLHLRSSASSASSATTSGSRGDDCSTASSSVVGSADLQ